ncbi:MAG: hypothetical protein QOI75_1635, partial [Pseudonocardiales bacterium]|nr:hypothetical protein [Pseudonocardiales bacterium]
MPRAPTTCLVCSSVTLAAAAWRRRQRSARRSGYRAGVLTSPDPTALSSPLGQLVVLAGLVASLVVL